MGRFRGRQGQFDNAILRRRIVDQSKTCEPGRARTGEEEETTDDKTS